MCVYVRLRARGVHHRRRWRGQRRPRRGRMEVSAKNSTSIAAEMQCHDAHMCTHILHTCARTSCTCMMHTYASTCARILDCVYIILDDADILLRYVHETHDDTSMYAHACIHDPCTCVYVCLFLRTRMHIHPCTCAYVCACIRVRACMPVHHLNHRCNF